MEENNPSIVHNKTKMEHFHSAKFFRMKIQNLNSEKLAEHNPDNQYEHVRVLIIVSSINSVNLQKLHGRRLVLPNAVQVLRMEIML